MTSNRLFDGRPLVVEDVPRAWSNRVGTQSSMSLSIIDSPSDSINETFSTAIEDDENETQYLSVLETTRDVTLEDSQDLKVGNSKITVPALELSSESGNNHLTDSGEQQVVIFKLEGSDDLYGIQLTRDEEGNVQKYQFQLRTREDGQLEAIPDTIQLLPNESNCSQKSSDQASGVDSQIGIDNEQILPAPVFISETQTQVDIVHSVAFPQEKENAFTDENSESRGGCQINNHNQELNENTLLVLIKNELSFQGVEKVVEDAVEIPEEGQRSENNYSEDENIDVKPGIVEIQENHQDASPANIKQEYNGNNRIFLQNKDICNEETAEIPYGEMEVHEETVIASPIECHGKADTYTTDPPDEKTLIEYQYLDSQSVNEVCEETNNPNNLLDQQKMSHEEHYSNIYIANGQIEELDCNSEIHQHIQEDIHYLQEEIRDNDSDNEDYEIVDGLPVTAEGDISEDSRSPIYEQESLHNEANIQHLPLGKHNSSMTTNILKHSKDESSNNKYSKKKNILYYMVKTDQKENVDSSPLGDRTMIPLKPNPRSLLKNNVEVKPQDNNELILEKVREREKALEKRFARSKEAVQAKLFNNFINKTTIPHAPIRQIRLPRKQEIKPVDTRRDEEIIVKEVMVSEKRFIENMKERLKSKDKFEVTSIVELSDSDEDYNPNSSSKKKKKHKKPVPISAVTSEDSDTSVIEILQSDEESNKRSKDYLSNKPGRSKKTLGDAVKRPRGRPPKHDGSSPQKKSRTESSEVESDAGKKNFKCPHCQKAFPSQNSLSTHIQHHNLENSLRHSTKFSTIEYKHKCDQCEEKFKNSILLKRHICQKVAKLKCNVCSKFFKDATLLNMHKKTHVKQNLMKTTSTVTISPKKFLPKPPISKLKSPKKTIPIYKCQCCSKICPTQISLTLHEKSHKNFACTNCKATFASKILLDTHVRLTCVKQATPKNGKLSFKIKKSFVQSPRRASVKRKSVNPGLNCASMSRPLDVEVTCDSCAMTFNTLTALFKHKVKDHGLQTPDKKVLAAEKKTLHKPLSTHGGIPASARLNKVFQGLREKMATLKTNSTPSDTFEKKLS